MELIDKINNAVNASLNNVGYDLVSIKIRTGGRMAVEIDIDRLDGGSVTVEDCVSASGVISAILDVEDFIKNSYVLEVSSPGEWRLLSKEADYERFCGKEIKVELFTPFDGKKKIFGVLERLERKESGISIFLSNWSDTNDGLLEISLNEIKKAGIKRF